MRMKDKVAIVTGASGGLGSEIARLSGGKARMLSQLPDEALKLRRSWQRR